MNDYKCIVIDDELYAIKGLQKYIAAVPNLELLKYYTDPMVALMEIKTSPPVDLILLDVDMPQITGIELAAEIRSKTRKLVFTTSHSKYGYEAFEAEADGYLLKPYTLSKFAGTVAKLFPQEDSLAPEGPEAEDFFFVKDKNDQLKMVRVKYSDVVLVESQQNYILIYAKEKKILTYMSLTEISRILRGFLNFVQFQRSFIINKNHIDTIDGNMIRMDNGKSVTVGEFYRKDFQTFIAKNLLKARRKDS